MQLSIEHIKEYTNGAFLNLNIYHSNIFKFSYDSRKISSAGQSLFIALKGKDTDGHDFIEAAYLKGVRHFLINKDIDPSAYPQANFIKVDSTILALQQLAQNYRQKLTASIIGITGSNGKTTVKEWLAQALSIRYKVGKSPMSYNSQLGVPLSILQLSKSDEVAIIEAGISEKGEMKILADIINPNIGIFTTIGDAHSQGFKTIEEKIKEKIALFKNAELIIYNADELQIHEAIKSLDEKRHFSWGNDKNNNIKILFQKAINKSTELKLLFKEEEYLIKLPFTDSHSITNAMHVISYLLIDGWKQHDIQGAVNEFQNLPNRLEIKNGINNCLLINDSYSADIVSLQAAINNLLSHHSFEKKIIFISDFDLQNSKELVYNQLAEILSHQKITDVVFIGLERKL